MKILELNNTITKQKFNWVNGDERRKPMDLKMNQQKLSSLNNRKEKKAEKKVNRAPKTQKA